MGELVFSSAIAWVPFVGGYMPNREIIHFRFEGARQMELLVDTLPFVPRMSIIGEDCAYDSATATISYRVRGKTASSTWRVLYADGEVLAAVSSVTGLNVARR